MVPLVDDCATDGPIYLTQEDFHALSRFLKEQIAHHNHLWRENCSPSIPPAPGL